MDYILAKVNKSLFKLISDKALYKDICFNNSNYINYDPDHHLDDECWFKIENFSEKDFCLSFLKQEFSSLEYDLFNKKDFLKIKYVVSVQEEGNIYCFQKITSSLFLKKARLIKFNALVEIDDKGEDKILIKELPDAISFKDKDILIFKKLSVISSIFNGIDILYKEATDKEVDFFYRSVLLF